MSKSSSPWSVISAGALYTGIDRGLAADILAARALGGRALSVCTSMVVASRGRVTDVVEVPTDTVRAQLEHLTETASPDGVKAGILGHRASVKPIFELAGALDAPFVFDITLSGPSGEDIADMQTREAIIAHLGVPDLVTVRRRDAELLVGMEINTLDDAQVAVQRFHKRGARRVLIRCGEIPARFFEENGRSEPFESDLYYDGEDFGLFEAPHLDLPEAHGASSALTMAVVKALADDQTITDALQAAKAFVTESLRHGRADENDWLLNFFHAQST